MEIFLGVLIALGIATGSFYWGRHISSIEQRNELLESTHSEALKHIDDIEKYLEELQQENEFMRKEAQTQGQRVNTPRTWNPADPLNSQARQ
jgi:F0F1-type ATP synthase membrane subunit b/b'